MYLSGSCIFHELIGSYPFVSARGKVSFPVDVVEDRALNQRYGETNSFLHEINKKDSAGFSSKPKPYHMHLLYHVYNFGKILTKRYHRGGYRLTISIYSANIYFLH